MAPRPITSTTPEDGHEFKPSRVVSYYRHGPGFEREYDPVVGADRVLNPGPLITDYPHAGILNTKVFLERYPTTATNRNRARSRWTYYHFLGLDIEKSASRTTDPVALADTNNPTLRNPACTVCHRIMDPVAGAFQNYGDEGLYKDQWPGLDSLDHFYKLAGEERNVRADSWEDREALSWPVFLGAGVQTLRVLYANDYYDPDTGDDGYIYLDRLRVRDARGGVLVSSEFEDLGPPMPPPGSDFGCGHEGYNPAGRHDHVWLFNGGVECAFFIDVEVPSDGVYDVEVVAWMNGRHELYGEDGFAKLSVMANGYRTGDTWYRDMRTPGFNGEQAPEPGQQRAVAGEADRRRQALRRGDGEVLVAGHHGQRGRGAARGRRGCGLRGAPARRQRPGGGGDAAGQRIPARLPGPGRVQLEGPAGRDGALEVVPRGRGRG